MTDSRALHTLAKPLHLFSSRRLTEDLAAGRVSSREQAAYLIVSFLTWTAAGYLYVMPSSRSTDPSFFWTLWLFEFVLVVLFTVAGVNFCLGKCRVDAKANFLVDFSCLYAPVALWTIVTVWGAFYVLTELPLVIIGRWNEKAPEQLMLLPWLSSSRAYDLLRFLAYVGMTFYIYLRVGEHMARVSELRSAGADDAER